MAESSADVVVLVATEGLSIALQRYVRTACEQMGARIVELRDVSSGLPLLTAEPLLVVAALPIGSRIVPPQLAALLFRELPEVPLCLFTDETLVRPSVTLNAGQLNLIGAPLGELRVMSWMHALLRRGVAVGRETTVTSVIGGDVRLVDQRQGALVLATITHTLVDSLPAMPRPLVEAAVGRGALLALAPEGVDMPALDAGGRPLPRDGVVGLSVNQHRELRLNVKRTDTDVRLGSPHRVPQVTTLDLATAHNLVLPMEPGDVVLVSWPRGAIDERLFSPLLLDGLQPTLAALELMNRVRTTAFAAVALEVR